ncbi:hypothetical protein SGRA_1426 [Saprospira grandis str. Lewin]|uniref:Uncharacterized protein n=1 Tax=Saprospira grandis (strain Lewin) TaxID=984262 RepID=H6L7U0_SAPGL|nr:hypothetical protein SGRA_1426 [Saprospira grandis str. Lewin]
MNRHAFIFWTKFVLFPFFQSNFLEKIGPRAGLSPALFRLGPNKSGPLWPSDVQQWPSGQTEARRAEGPSE